MNWELSEPLGEPRDVCERAADTAEFTREMALRAHVARVEIGEGQMIDAAGRVLCLWCEEPIDAARLAAQPAAVRHEECQDDFEQFQRRHG